MSIRIVLIDDHQKIRESIRQLLDQETDLEVVSEAGEGGSGLEATYRHQPDVVVLDLSLPGLHGLELVGRMRAEAPGSRLVALSTLSEQYLVDSVLQAGAAGYVLKKAAFHELVPAIRQVMAGQVYLSSAIAAPAPNPTARLHPSPSTLQPGESL